MLYFWRLVLTPKFIFGLLSFLSVSVVFAQEVVYPAVGSWNGYLGQVNVVECVNGSASPVSVKITVRASSGKSLGQVSKSVPGHGTFHLILNEFGISNSYGTYLVETPSAEFAELSCLTAVYRFPQSDSAKKVEYAYVLPVRTPVTGIVSGLFNSMNPKGGSTPVVNFLSVVNVGHSDFDAQVEVYNANGSKVPSQGFNIQGLKPGRRMDFPLGHPFGQVLGSYQITPANSSAEYQAFTVRYGQERLDKFSFAFALQAQRGSCSPHPLYASTFGPAYNWAELFNPSSKALTVGVSLRSQNGDLLLQEKTFILAPNAQKHLPLHQYLGADNIGSLYVRCIEADVGQNVYAQSLLYGLKPEVPSELNWAYAHQMQLSPLTDGRQLLSHLNTHLSADNWALLINTDSSAASLRTRSHSRGGGELGEVQTTVPALGLRSVALHPQTGFDYYGLGATSHKTAGGNAVSELLRVYRNSAGNIDYIANVPSVPFFEAPSGGGTYANSVSQYGITWEFDRPHRVGQFVNGDWWVVVNDKTGVVNITNITPEFNGVRHGWEVNKGKAFPQGFDSRVTGGFDASLIPELPYAAGPNESIIKSISREVDASSCRPCLQTAAVLTVLAEAPYAEGANIFRPPFAGNLKPLYSTSQINYNLLPTVTPPTGFNFDFATFEQRFKMPQIDVSAYPGEDIRPYENFLRGTAYRGYGGRVAIDNGDAALGLMLNYSVSEKQELLIYFLQYGLDLFHMLDNGFAWGPNGGHGSGRKLPVILTAHLFNNQVMKNRILEVVQAKKETFQEDGFLYYGTEVGGVRPVLFGEGTSTYWLNVVTDYGSRTARDPHGYIDSRIPGTSYQKGINSLIWKGPMVAMQIIPELQELWAEQYYQMFEEYVDRWVDHGAWSQPDVCAPAEGVCIGGERDGERCTYAMEDFCTGGSCGAGTCPSGPDQGKPCGYSVGCAPNSNGSTIRCTFNANYGVTYGPVPNNPSQCILDTDPSDGIGRFPYRHGRDANEGGAGYISTFVNNMWDLYR